MRKFSGLNYIYMYFVKNEAQIILHSDYILLSIQIMYTCTYFIVTKNHDIISERAYLVVPIACFFYNNYKNHSFETTRV